jgi:replicative DNA helicase
MTELAWQAPPEVEDRPEQAPQQDLLAEQSVLGACLLSGNAIDECEEIGLRGSHFYRPAHALVWDALSHLRHTRQPTDGVMVANVLRERGELDRAGGPAYLHTLAEAVPSVASARHYAKIIRKHSVFRNLTGAGRRITSLGLAPDGSEVGEILHVAQRELAAVADGAFDTETETLDDIANAAMASLEVPEVFTPTPWWSLNDVFEGVRPGHLYVLGARPGTGKTIFSLQWGIDFSRRHRRDRLGCAYLTWEMTAPRLYRRALSQASGVTSTKMRRRDLQERDWKALAQADQELRTLPLSLVQASGWSAQMVRAKARQVARKHPIGLLIIDHFGLIRAEAGGRSENRQTELSAAADLLLDLGKELDCGVLLVSQLNRAPMGRADQRPVPSDLRDTDRLEQNADVVIMLHRDRERDPGKLVVSVPKDRDGAEALVNMIFEGDEARILDATPYPGARR